MFDSHVHSSFSGDSDMEALIACETAIKLGLSGIAFTDHLDYDYPDFDDAFLIDFDKYSDYMDGLKSKFKNTLKVLKGIEIGLQPHVLNDTLKVVNSYDFDFVIASVHVVHKTDLHNGDFCKGKSQKQSYTIYLEEISKTLDLYDNFDILGHMDLIRRYGNYDNKILRHSDYSDIIDEIFKKLIAKGKGIEVNASGYRYNLESPMPDFDIIRRYKDMGGEIISIGSDAHVPEYIGFKFGYLKELLIKAGFKYTVHFENRRPIFDKI